MCGLVPLLAFISGLLRRVDITAFNDGARKACIVGFGALGLEV